MPQDLSKFPIEQQKAYYLNFLTWLLPKSFWLESLPDYKEDIEEIIPFGNDRGYRFYEIHKEDKNIDELLTRKIELLHSVLKPKVDFDWRDFIIKHYLSKKDRESDMIKDAYNYNGESYYDIKKAYNYKFDLPSDLPLHSKILTGKEKLEYYTEEQWQFYSICFLLGKVIFLEQTLYNNFAFEFKITSIGHATKFHSLILYYARMLFMMLYSFLECFVNSVAYNYVLINDIDEDSSIRKVLGGKDKDGKYIPINKKLNYFPQIICNRINSHEHWLIQKNYNKKYSYPDRNSYEDLRDSLTHPNLDQQMNPEKINFLNPIVCIEQAYEYYMVIIDTIKLFWDFCYPNIELTYLKMNEESVAKMVVDDINYELSLGAIETHPERKHEYKYFKDVIKEKIRNVILCKEAP